MRFETQITVTFSYRDERIIFFSILILKSEILDSFFLIPINRINSNYRFQKRILPKIPI